MEGITELITADRIVNGTTRDRIGFCIRWAREIERQSGALRDTGDLIAKGQRADVEQFDQIVAALLDVIARYRTDCVAIIALRARR